MKEAYITELDVFTIEFEFESKGKYNSNPYHDTLEEHIEINRILTLDSEGEELEVKWESLNVELQYNIIAHCTDIGREDAE